MIAKIMHHCAFLIITFSSYSLCIQNGKTVTVDKLERKSNFPPEARQSTFKQSAFDGSGFIPSSRGGFSFPDKHQYNTNNAANELPSAGYRNPYPNIQVANNNQGANPHNLALNTGEHSPYANNHNNNYLYRQHPNAIAGFGNRESNGFYLSSPPYQHFNNKNPNYPPPPQRQQQFQQRPTYASAYGNYLYNGQPNYNRRPTPPPQPPPPPQSASSYSPYQDGHFTAPYRNDLTSLLSSVLSGGQQTTYPPQYANQFDNFALPFGGGGGNGGGNGGNGGAGASANPLGSLFNSIGTPFAGGNPLSMQIIRGLENIARNDDLQCVPKVLCQMLGSPTRRAQLPSFITSPVLTRFVSSLPSSSPALIFGRAALLGLSGGEYSCSRTYAKCPQNEDDILFYLNNHRGGFFKFFSEPDTQPVQDSQHNYATTPSSSASQSQPSIFNFLTGLTSPTTTNTNQGSLNSFMSDAVTNGIGSLFGNIISGYLSGQAATRRSDDDDDKHDDEQDSTEDAADSIESNATADNGTDKVQGRILNNKSNILAYVEPSHNPISFPIGSGHGNNYGAQQFESEFRFPSTTNRDADNDDDDRYRRGKRVNFIDSGYRPAQGTKMIFPDRTGTGNLRFDNDEYFRVGKIINRLESNRGYTDKQKEIYTTTNRTPNYNAYTKASYSSNSYSDANLNRYSSSNYPQSNKEDTTGNVYVTNGQGVLEYYINAQGRKVYL